MDIEFSEAADINVEVQALNLDGIKQNLLDYVQDQVKIDIDDSVDKADKSAQSAETYAAEAAVSATTASACAEQTLENLGLYYKKNETDMLLNAKAAKATTLSGYGITDGANTALSNLNSNGQMIIDSQNGTISNCVLEIPQNLKLEISGTTITLKAGSTFVMANGETYTTVTTTEDHSATINTDYALISTDISGHIFGNRSKGEFLSGTTAQLPVNRTGFYFNTDTKEIRYYTNGIAGNTTYAYPLCLCRYQNGTASFAKDKNGNDMIFNGAGFVGHHIFTYPSVKFLIPNGINNDGSLKSVKITKPSLLIIEMQNTTNSQTNGCVAVYGEGALAARLNYYEVLEESEMDQLNAQAIYYVKNNNMGYSWGGRPGVKYSGFVRFIDYLFNGTTVTDFAIRQPVRTATVEMLNSALGDIETLLAAI